MKYALTVIALLVFGQFTPTSAQAQVNPACAGLEDRFQRQDRIAAAYNCALQRDQPALRGRQSALQRCRFADQARLRDVAEEHAEALERCVADRLDKQVAGARPANPGVNASPAGVKQPGLNQPRLGAKTSGQRIKDLLAEVPGGQRTSATDAAPRLRSREFRSGLVWSFGGKIAGMHCVQWREPSDPHKWDDNYLCTERDVGFQWSFRGPILGRGLKCIQVREKSDPHDWHDNYFCWPRDLAVTFKFSSTGRIAGMRCVAIVEPSDPHTWQDNYLCHEPRQG